MIAAGSSPDAAHAASLREASAGGQHNDLGDALRRTAAQFEAPLPTVIVQYRPPCAVTASEILDADADTVIRSVCRALQRGPGALAFDPTTRTAKGAEDPAGHQVWVCDHAEQRLARITGITVTWLRIAAAVLARRGWTPGRNGEAVPAQAAALRERGGSGHQ